MADFVIEEWDLSGYDDDQAPMHRHDGGEEAFVCISGDLEVEINGQRSRVEPGAYVLIPRGTAHTFATHSGARVLAIMTEEIARLVQGLHSAPSDEAREALWKECRSALV
jgi:glyoxylate utilization-related uncharacterized protein